MRSRDGMNLAWRTVNAIRDGVNLTWRIVNAIRDGLNLIWRGLNAIWDGVNLVWSRTKCRAICVHGDHRTVALRKIYFALLPSGSSAPPGRTFMGTRFQGSLAALRTPG